MRPALGNLLAGSRERAFAPAATAAATITAAPFARLLARLVLVFAVLRFGAALRRRFTEDTRRQRNLGVMSLLRFRFGRMSVMLVLMLRLRSLLRISAAGAMMRLLIAVISTVVAVALTIIVRLLVAALPAFEPALTIVLLLESRIQNTVVMVGVLEIVLGQYAVARRCGVTRERQILLHQLLGVAPRPIIATIEVWIAARGTRFTTAAAAVTSALTSLHVILLIFIQVVKDPGKAPNETSALNVWRGAEPRQHGFFWGWHAGGKSNRPFCEIHCASNVEALPLWAMRISLSEFKSSVPGGDVQAFFASLEG